MKNILKNRAAAIERYLSASVETFPGTPDRLKESMAYSLSAGGKRIRPALCLTTASLFGAIEENILPFAAAIEMIHTYSLIHDDLPAMDDDDLRRGKPSNHKAFDEATAILAGDGLLTDAFLIMTRTKADPEKLIEAIKTFSLAAGSAGMVGGQELDMLYTGKSGITLEQIEDMQKLKTGAIIKASCLCGAILAGANAEDCKRIGEYGAAIGKSFQIVDDILDIVADEKTLGKPKGSDIEAGKNTWPSKAGIEASKAAAERETRKAIAALQTYSGEDANFLRGLAEYIINRAN